MKQLEPNNQNALFPDKGFLSSSEVDEAQVLNKVVFSVASGIDSMGRTVKERESTRDSSLQNFGIMKHEAAIFRLF